MELHPIPQDVTGFKFRLIGSITVKQFLYLLVAGVSTTLTLFVFPIHPIIKVPLVFIFVVLGTSLAFIPIEGRSMDKMLINFLKTIPSENQYIYRKHGVALRLDISQRQKDHTSSKRSKTQDYSKTILAAKPSAGIVPDEEEARSITAIKSLFEVAEKGAVVQSTPRPVEQAQEVTQKESKKTSFPTLIDTPNIVTGTVLDPRGKPLQNIIVEIIDANNIPVRAFKTNQLGQFASATSLSNGTYKVNLDDPRKQHEFTPIEITLDGSIPQPLEITSVDAREKLRRELFGNQVLV